VKIPHGTATVSGEQAPTLDRASTDGTIRHCEAELKFGPTYVADDSALM